MGEKPRAVSSHDITLDKEYAQWIHDIKQRFRNAQIKASVKVNSEQLLFNWQLGRDLVIRKAEEKWGSGIVEQVSLDLQAAFPKAKGFSARNLWFMKQWYTFYASAADSIHLISNLEKRIDTGSLKLNQVASEIQEPKLKQLDSELLFPSVFAFVPYCHPMQTAGGSVMASSKEYLDFVLDQLSELDKITFKAMMGESNNFVFFRTINQLTPITLIHSIKLNDAPFLAGRSSHLRHCRQQSCRHRKGCKK